MASLLISVLSKEQTNLNSYPQIQCISRRCREMICTNPRHPERSEGPPDGRKILRRKLL
jgi:hypothetical protein